MLFALCILNLNSRAPINKHVVKKGETLYSISKRYGLKVNEFIKANPVLAKTPNVRIGQTLVVPAKGKEQTFYKPVYVPSTPDTPYREEDVRPRNTSILKSQAIIEQDKIAPEKPLAVETSKPLVTSLRTNSTNASEYPVIFNQYANIGFKIRKNKGAANYLADATSGNQHLAFYNGAETGSVIRVTNLMNKKTVFVKVVGKVPPTDASQEITLKLSNTAAQDLGAIDEKFLVEVASYSSN